MANGDAMFGQAATFNSDAGFVLAVSDDKKAFTATFSGLAVSLDPGSSTPVVTRVFTFVLPLSGAAPDTEIPFFVSGFAFSEKGANGHLVFSINDQTTVVDFPGNSDQDSSNNSNSKLDLRPRFGLPFSSGLIASRNRTRQ
jgi:hypothetical protein